MFLNWRRKPSKAMTAEAEEYAKLELIDREADRQLTAHAQTSGAIATRAALVVSTAIFFVSLSKDIGEGSWAYTIALVSAALGVIHGVWALFMNRSGEEVDLDGTEKAFQRLSRNSALKSMVQAKLETLDQDRNWLQRRELLTRIGFLLLGVSLASTVVHIIFL